MAKYRVLVEKQAEKDVRQLPGHVRQRVRRIIRSLGDDPRPEGTKELRDLPGYYRISLDKWRIIYHIEEEEIEGEDGVFTVIVLRVPLKTGPETYEDLER
jgi:mRNA interferase RelE/StbE